VPDAAPPPLTLRPRAAFTCPECGWSGEFETRFPAWCLECTHGAETDQPAKPPKFFERRRKAAAARRSTKLYNRLVSAGQLRPTGLLRFSVLSFALLIHLTTLAILATGIGLMALRPHAVRGWLGGPLLVVLAVWIRPRVPAWDKHTRRCTPADAPQFFALLDEIADLLGADRIAAVSFEPVCSAGVTALGLRRRRVLIIGVPLWEVLTPQERVAVLAHEAAHSVNSDVEYGHIVGSALGTLRRWYAMTHPLTYVTRHSKLRTRNLVDLVLPFHLLHAGAVAMLRRSKPRAEYTADHLAAGVASTEAACAAFERLTTAKAATAVLARAVRAAVPSHPWRIVREYAAALPEHERRRLALLDERAGVAIDATHPPTHLRIKMLRERPALPARLTLTAERSAALDAEVAPFVERVAGRVREFALR
jgi:Zn-dependent protease with chaperone function